MDELLPDAIVRIFTLYSENNKNISFSDKFKMMDMATSLLLCKSKNIKDEALLLYIGFMIHNQGNLSKQELLDKVSLLEKSGDKNSLLSAAYLSNEDYVNHHRLLIKAKEKNSSLAAFDLGKTNDFMSQLF